MQYIFLTSLGSKFLKLFCISLSAANIAFPASIIRFYYVTGRFSLIYFSSSSMSVDNW